MQKNKQSIRQTRTKRKTSKSSFKGIFGGKQQKGKAALGAVLSFAAVGSYLLITSFAAPGTLKPQGTYSNWQWASNIPQQHSILDTSLTIENDPTAQHPAYGYYWASQFSMLESGGYMGIQTRGEAGDYRGKVAIFALWSTNAGVENGSQGSYCSMHSSGFDGGAKDYGSTCRIPLNWQNGDKYNLRLEVVASDATTRTWQASVTNQANGQRLVIGKIKTSLSYGLLKPTLSNWTEFYLAARSTCEMPYSRVVFGTPRFNNWFAPSSHQNNITSGDCVSKITDVSGGVRHEQGNPQATSALPALPAGGTYLSDLPWKSATTGYGVITKDKSLHNDGTPINLAGKTFAKGLGTHAVSDIRYALDGKYSRFVGYVNMQFGGGGKIGYEVWADGQKLFDSGPMDTYSYTQAITVDVTGKKELKLVVNDAGDGIGADWGAWADVRLISSTALTPTEPAPTPQPAPNPQPAPTPQPAPAPPVGDTVAPSARIISPANGGTVGNGTYIQASATDNVNVAKMEIYIDGRLYASSNSSSITYTWVSYYASAGPHNITVKAYDAAGNMGQSTITVTK